MLRPHRSGAWQLCAMPLGAVDSLSDAGSEKGPDDGAKPKASPKPKKIAAKLKPKMPAKKKDDGKKPGDSNGAPAVIEDAGDDEASASQPSGVKKKPAAGKSKSFKRPAASLNTLPRKANKYWYRKDGKIGIKVDDKHEVMTVQASESKRAIF